MERLKQWWQHIPRAVRKPLVFIVGVAIVIIGIILLPLPGPGWVIIFAGFAVLATEFAFAEKVRDWLVAAVKAALEYCKQVWNRLRGKPSSSAAAPHSPKRTRRKH